MLTIFLDKSRPTHRRISKPSEEHSRGSAEFPNQNLRQMRPGIEFLSDKQIEKAKLQLNKYRRLKHNQYQHFACPRSLYLDNNSPVHMYCHYYTINKLVF